jgi:muramidase (phage lysozyme)
MPWNPKQKFAMSSGQYQFIKKIWENYFKNLGKFVFIINAPLSMVIKQ